ncbi:MULTISPECIES: hypothetical protein [Roseivirga]|uniref:Uncharacterized protein n=1 Tax=Roseivirga spongicola TaxID=333140 RepID=A0A150X5V2_9BACT|nr:MULTISPECIES: hypothetical protein [Roseivirga]KYG74066.1 hypothetical protein AWW68_15520 [Roseivirga spongicola]MBO6660377.1 hypothetical protein [Roseivirga sp.]MBO6906886.1 hypothetical protein [Roseivirga sp.]WPZ09284.1 hypothetical protein T7867_13555 [Roseivirga spongicola]
MKKIIIITIISISALSACNNKSAKENNPSKEITPIEDSSNMGSERKTDSLRQIKEHGHAH